MSNVTTCPECGSKYYEFPCKIETQAFTASGPMAVPRARLVYICENEHTYYGPWADVDSR